MNQTDIDVAQKVMGWTPAELGAAWQPSSNLQAAAAVLEKLDAHPGLTVKTGRFGSIHEIAIAPKGSEEHVRAIGGDFCTVVCDVALQAAAKGWLA